MECPLRNEKGFFLPHAPTNLALPFLLQEAPTMRTHDHPVAEALDALSAGGYEDASTVQAVLNNNIYTGLKVVNGAEFTAADIIPDPRYPGYYLADDVTIHFGPPLGILLHSTETKTLTIPILPPQTVLIRPTSYTVGEMLSTWTTRRSSICPYRLQGKAKPSCSCSWNCAETA